MHPVFGENEIHSQEQLKLLLKNPIVQELFDILENEGSSVLKELDLSYVNTVFDNEKTTNRDRHGYIHLMINYRLFYMDLLKGNEQSEVSANVFKSLSRSCFSILINSPPFYKRY